MGIISRIFGENTVLGSGTPGVVGDTVLVCREDDLCMFRIQSGSSIPEFVVYSERRNVCVYMVLPAYAYMVFDRIKSNDIDLSGDQAVLLNETMKKARAGDGRAKAIIETMGENNRYDATKHIDKFKRILRNVSS